MAPDVHTAVIAYLAAHEDVGGAGVRVSPKTPSSLNAPWVRVTLINDPATDGGITDHHVEALLQLEVYAGKANNSTVEANALSNLVREAIRVMQDADHADVVVTGAMSSRAYMPDDTVGEPVLERYTVSSTVWARSK
jgi:hypothetical protein